MHKPCPPPLTAADRRRFAAMSAGSGTVAAAAGVKPRTVARWRQQFNIAAPAAGRRPASAGATLRPPRLARRAADAARRQYRRRTSRPANVLLSSRHKAAMVEAGSMFEAVHAYMNEWRGFAAAHPGDPRAAAPPFDGDLLARAETFDPARLSRPHRRRLAAAWDEHRSATTCGGGCWEHSAARGAFDLAIAQIEGRDAASVAADMAQVVNARRLIDDIRGTPGASTVCEAPGTCAGAAA